MKLQHKIITDEFNRPAYLTLKVGDFSHRIVRSENLSGWTQEINKDDLKNLKIDLSNFIIKE